MDEYRVDDTTVYVADVTLASADYLKTAFAQNTYGRNVTEKTSSIAASVDAILAINGDYYGAQQSGYVIRNGVLYRSRASRDAEDLVIFKDGSFTVISESEITAEALLEAGAWNVLSFGPALVADGEIAVSVNDEVGRAKASNPRTAIGVIDDLHYVFAVSDGRTSESEGLSLYELAEFLQSLGVRTAVLERVTTPSLRAGSEFAVGVRTSAESLSLSSAMEPAPGVTPSGNVAFHAAAVGAEIADVVVSPTLPLNQSISVASALTEATHASAHAVIPTIF